jgi:hypothetical protein
LKTISKSIVMKKITTFLLTASILLCFSSINAQTGFGVKAGVNIANITDNPYKPRVGVHGGVFVNRAISRHFAVQPELLFSGEGQRVMFNSLVGLSLRINDIIKPTSTTNDQNGK